MSAARRTSALVAALVMASSVLAQDAPSAADPVLIIALHPWGSRGRAMERVVAAAGLPCDHVVWAPDGSLPAGRGHAWLGHLVGDGAHRAALGRDAARAADTLVARLRARAPGQRAIVTGISQGAVVAYALAAAHPDAADAVVAASGLLPEGLPVHEGDVPIVAVHGERDAFVPFARLQAGLTRLRAAGRRVELHRFPRAGHRVRGPLRAAHQDALRAAACPEATRGEP